MEDRFFQCSFTKIIVYRCASLAKKKSKLLPVLPHVSDGLTETGVRLYSVLLQLCRETRVQFLHHGAAMNLVKAQPFLGRHARFAGQLIMMIDLPQSFQDVTAFGGKFGATSTKRRLP